MIPYFLKILDLFRSPILLYYNGDQKRSSALGFLSSLIIYVYLFYSFFQSSLYLKENPIVVIQNLQEQHAEAMHFDKNKFLAFGLTDVFDNRVVDPSIFTIQFRYFQNASIYEMRELKICELEDVNGNQTFYDFYRLKYMFCLKNRSFFLEGTADENARYIVISLFLCNNATSNNTCKSQEYLDQFFNSYASTKMFTVMYDDVLVDVENYKEPFKKLIKVELQIIDPAVKKRNLIYFKKTTMVTDSGSLFQNLETQANFIFSTKDFDFQIRQNPNQPLFQYLFFSSKDEVSYKRRYQTIAEFLGGFAGVAKLFSIICGIFVNHFIYIDTLKHILNKIYAFPSYRKKKTSKKKIKTNLKKKKIEKIDLVTLTQSEQKNFCFKSPLRESSQMKASLINNENFDNKNSNQFKINSFAIEYNNSSPIKNETPKSINLPKFNKKDFEDSFVLEHFSLRSCPEREISHVSKPIQNIDSLRATDLGVKALNVKIVESHYIEKISPQKEAVYQEPKKKKLKDRIVSFFKKKKEGKIQNKLHFSYWEYFSMIFDVFKSKKSVRHQLIRKAEKTYNEDLDLVNLMRKLHDLDKLKILLLDEDQLVLFNFLSKPVINIDMLNEKEMDETLSVSQRRVTHLMNRGKNAKLYLEESYKKVFEKTDKISFKLVEFFDQEIHRLANLRSEKEII